MSKTFFIFRLITKFPDLTKSFFHCLFWINTAESLGYNGDKVQFTADSDAIITKGIIALLVRVLSGQKAGDIANSDLYFIDKIGLKEHLSPTRSNGVVSMIKQMKLYGLALQAKNNG